MMTGPLLVAALPSTKRGTCPSVEYTRLLTVIFVDNVYRSLAQELDVRVATAADQVTFSLCTPDQERIITDAIIIA